MHLYKRGRVWWLKDGSYRETTGCARREDAEIAKRRRERERADPAHAAKDAATLADAIKIIRDEMGARRRSDGTPVPEATIEVY